MHRAVLQALAFVWVFSSAPALAASALKYVKTCDPLIEDSACNGRYGFWIFSDGSYQVGPGPKDELRVGKLEGEEIRELNEGITRAPVFGVDSLGEMNCESDAWAYAYDDAISLVDPETDTLLESLVKSEGTSICHLATRFESASKALEFEDAVYRLVEKYGSEFPSAAPAPEYLAELDLCEVQGGCSCFDELF